MALLLAVKKLLAGCSASAYARFSAASTAMLRALTSRVADRAHLLVDLAHRGEAARSAAFRQPRR